MKITKTSYTIHISEEQRVGLMKVLNEKVTQEELSQLGLKYWPEMLKEMEGDYETIQGFCL